jgi:hypothetical protein
MPRAIARAAVLTKAAMRAPPGARIAAYVFCAAATKPVDAETNSVYKYTRIARLWILSGTRIKRRVTFASTESGSLKR